MKKQDFSIGSSIDSAGGGDTCTIWADWNQDFDFDDPGEAVSLHTGLPKFHPYDNTTIFTNSFSGIVSVPDDALPGLTRMRVRTVDGQPEPCGTTIGGEVEDYGLMVYQKGQCPDEDVYGGGSGTVDDPYQIATAEQLKMIGENPWHWDQHFVLTADVDLSMYQGNEFNCIGDRFIPFGGTFEGNHHVISNFTYTTTSASRIGLFGSVNGGTITNVMMKNPAIQVNTSGTSAQAMAIGTLVGLMTHNSRVENCFVNEGSVTGAYAVGGLIGSAENSTITKCSADATVNGQGAVGGLIGRMDDSSIQQSFSKGLVQATEKISFPSGLLAEYNEIRAGGFIGRGDDSEIADCYARCQVNSEEDAAGFAGSLLSTTQVYNCYSASVVTGLPSSSFEKGFVLSNSAAISNCYWDRDVATVTTSAGGTSLTTEQMQSLSSYTNWDFENTWRICDGMNYPRLLWEPKPVGDFVCPEGVELADLMVLCDEWLAEGPAAFADMAPDGGDGIVNLADWQRLAGAWNTSQGQPGYDVHCDLAPETPDGVIDVQDVCVFADQWLYRSSTYADIAPTAAPDGRVDLADYGVFAENWLVGL